MKNQEKQKLFMENRVPKNPFMRNQKQKSPIKEKPITVNRRTKNPMAIMADRRREKGNKRIRSNTS